MTTRWTRSTAATAEATQAAIYDALFEAKTMTGRNGVTVYALPGERVMEMLRAAHAISALAAAMKIVDADHPLHAEPVG